MEFFYKMFRISARPPLIVESVNLVAYDFDVPYTKAANELGYKPIVGKKEAFRRLGAYLKMKDAGFKLTN
jgi:hypothetical protein